MYCTWHAVFLQIFEMVFLLLSRLIRFLFVLNAWHFVGANQVIEPCVSRTPEAQDHCHSGVTLSSLRSVCRRALCFPAQKEEA
jgi:hypothetical protein